MATVHDTPMTHKQTDTPARLALHVHEGHSLLGRLGRLEACFQHGNGVLPLSVHPGWLAVLQRGLNHVPFCLEACVGERSCGYLALAHVSSLLFGRFLVSLPYVNYGGVVASDVATHKLLVDGAVRLADDLKVRYLELRHETALPHPALNHSRTDKVHMRLDLPATSQQLWDGLPSKVRNQIRKARKAELTVAWGSQDLLPEFYALFSHNMRDLGTPVYGKNLFANILFQFPKRAEICVVRAGKRPIAGALLLHGRNITEVPSASSLREFNHTCANMLLYWQLLERTVEGGQAVFDFGRSSKDSSTHKFKRQWGAVPIPAEWQYYLRCGNPAEAQKENPRYQKLIRIWQKLPVSLTRLLGPAIVRGIP